uniref:Uncharacterized protein n=1 Tax=Aegilops tauschii subsp. strangulata TaxID=200361 RepID=A0A453PM06_AEGTS
IALPSMEVTTVAVRSVPHGAAASVEKLLGLWTNLGCNNPAAEARSVNLIYHPCGCMMRCPRFNCWCLLGS